jgi:hypothetical protein
MRRTLGADAWERGAGAAGTALGAEAGTTLDFAGLLVVLATAHLFLDAAALDQLAEAADRFLGRLSVA